MDLPELSPISSKNFYTEHDLSEQNNQQQHPLNFSTLGNPLRHNTSDFYHSRDILRQHQEQQQQRRQLNSPSQNLNLQHHNFLHHSSHNSHHYHNPPINRHFINHHLQYNTPIDSPSNRDAYQNNSSSDMPDLAPISVKNYGHYQNVVDKNQLEKLSRRNYDTFIAEHDTGSEFLRLDLSKFCMMIFSRSNKNPGKTTIT